jgi:hypothetical protein
MLWSAVERACFKNSMHKDGFLELVKGAFGGNIKKNTGFACSAEKLVRKGWKGI